MTQEEGNRVITFGCRLNSYESELIKDALKKTTEKNLIVFNSCAVTNKAEQDLASAIRKTKKENPDSKIVITGCAAQINFAKYAKMKEVDLVLGNAEKSDFSKYDLENKLGLNRDEFKLAGVLILFNNLLQSLFKSQILTLGVVMAGITLMFLILFRNITLSLIGVVPNFMAAFLILGIIGLLGIPLDMMTITIAAITIGIAVDNSIHYIYRFKEEFKKINDYNQTLEKCHDTVGVAILNTSITIVFGFSILVLSNFIPTIYFGIFTGIAMLLAMISVLTLLPKLILIVKPFGNV